MAEGGSGRYFFVRTMTFYKMVFIIDPNFFCKKVVFKRFDKLIYARIDVQIKYKH